MFNKNTALDYALMSKGQVCTFDIETAGLDGLDARKSYMSAACIKQVNPHNLLGKTYSFRIDNYEDKFNDREIVRNVVDCLNSFDLVLTWNGSQFDIPYVNARAVKHRIAPPLRNYRRDLLFMARANFRFRSHRLEVHDKFLHGDRSLKNHLTYDEHLAVIRGEKWAIDKLVDHCEKDVLITEKVYKRYFSLLGKLKRG